MKLTVNAGAHARKLAPINVALTAENLGTYTFGHASNYGGKLYTKGGSYATTGITYAE